MKRVVGVAVLCAMILFLGSAGLAEARGPHVVWGFWFPPFMGPWWGPPYPHPAPPPVIIQQPPVVQSAPPVQAPVYWYYCPNPAGYYPYVQQCPSGWMQVVPPAAPPAQ